jgi:hypothetical protein
VRLDGWFLAVALLAVGCGADNGVENLSERGLDAGGDDTDPTPDTTPHSNTTGTDDTGTVVEPAWWSVEADLVIAGGEVDTGTSVWTVRLWGPAGEETPCVIDVPILDVAAAVPPAIEAGTLVSWWTVELGATPAMSVCPSWPAAVTNLGFGPYDERLDAASDAHEWLALDLYGLYVQADPADPVLVVGVAGTTEQFEGKAQSVALPPIQDGTYHAETLILLSLDSTSP